MTNHPFSVAPVGTCRIHTPLRRGAGRYPIRPVLTRNYGFVHTSSEALQQLRFMFGETDLPEDVRRLTFRPSVSADFDVQTHARADLYLVELSSTKLLTVDGYPIQINYMARYFGDFFADKERSRMFWALSAPRRLAERRRLLREDFAFQRLCAADRDLLERIQKRDLGDDEIERDMREIADRLGGDNLVFVTHVDAQTPDNVPIEQRRKLIAAVRAAARKMDVRCFDPTRLMRALGQANAMENGGLDLTHYTDLFCDRLCDTWYTTFVVPRMGDPGEDAAAPGPLDAPGAALADIEAKWNAGQLREASAELRDLLRSGAGGPAHRMLLGRMQYELGDYEGAIEQFGASGGDAGADDKLAVMRMQCYFRTGEYRQAARIAAALIADEKETPDTLRICAVSAQALGDMESALNNWKRLFRIAPHDSDAATAAARLLVESNDIEGARLWADEVRRIWPQHRASFEILWNGKLTEADREGLIALAREPVDLDGPCRLALARQSADSGFAVPAALLAVGQGAGRTATPEIAAWIAEQASEWLERGRAALDVGDLLRAADDLQARWLLNPDGNALIRARRALERQMRHGVQAALMSKDYQAAARILEMAGKTLFTFTAFDSLRIRLAAIVGDVPAALSYLHRASEPDIVISGTDWLRLARTAVRGACYGEAIDAYARVLSSGSGDEATRSEAARQIVGLKSRAIRHARECVAAGDHERAWALLDRLQQFVPDGRDVQAEKKRVLKALYAQVKALDPASDADRLALGKVILRMVPDDPVGLKAAATGAMRVHRFDDALKYWQALRNSAASPELIDANMQKCRAWIDRANRRKAV